MKDQSLAKTTISLTNQHQWSFKIRTRVWLNKDQLTSWIALERRNCKHRLSKWKATLKNLSMNKDSYLTRNNNISINPLAGQLKKRKRSLFMNLQRCQASSRSINRDNYQSMIMPLTLWNKMILNQSKTKQWAWNHYHLNSSNQRLKVLKDFKMPLTINASKRRNWMKELPI